jgi:hypothetical protein
MLEDQIFTQARFGTKVTHRFGEYQLTYTLRDYSGEIQFSARYETITFRQPYAALVKDKPFTRRITMIAGAILLCLGLLGLFKWSLIPVIAWIAVFIFVAVNAINSTNLFATKCTMLKMVPPPPGAGKLGIRIMQDENHAAILAELEKRWVARVRKLHGAIDFSNDTKKELAKFAWLKENFVITDDEYREAVDRLNATMQTSDPEPHARDLN